MIVGIRQERMNIYHLMKIVYGWNRIYLSMRK